MRTILILTAASIITGCTTSQMYHGAKQYEVNRCLQTTSNAEYDDCIKRTEKTFNEYNVERDAVNEDQ